MGAARAPSEEVWEGGQRGLIMPDLPSDAPTQVPAPTEGRALGCDEETQGFRCRGGTVTCRFFGSGATRPTDP